MSQIRQTWTLWLLFVQRLTPALGLKEGIRLRADYA